MFEYREFLYSDVSHALPLALRAREHFYCTSVAHRDRLQNTVKSPKWLPRIKDAWQVAAASLMYSDSSPAPSAAWETPSAQKMLRAARWGDSPRHRDFLPVGTKPTPVTPRTPPRRRDSGVAKHGMLQDWLMMLMGLGPAGKGSN